MGKFREVLVLTLLSVNVRSSLHIMLVGGLAISVVFFICGVTYVWHNGTTYEMAVSLHLYVPLVFLDIFSL